ncbi:hypothetical protein AMTRI_Chr02g258130 [Amborella trichopoda]
MKIRVLPQDLIARSRGKGLKSSFWWIFNNFPFFLFESRSNIRIADSYNHLKTSSYATPPLDGIYSPQPSPILKYKYMMNMVICKINLSKSPISQGKRASDGYNFDVTFK